MKGYLFLILFFCCQFYHAGKIPNSILREIQANYIGSKAILLNLDFSECSNCNAFYFEYVSNFYPIYHPFFYCITKNEDEKERLLALLNHQKVPISEDRIIVNQSLTKFFEKDKKFLIKLNEKTYDFVDINKDFNSELAFLNSVKKTHLIPLDSTHVDVGFLKTNSNIIQKSRDQYYFLNTDLNEFYCVSPNSDLKSYFLDSLMDKHTLFDLLHLDSLDSVLTRNELFDSKTFGNKFLEVKNYQFSGDNELYFTLSISYAHQLNAEEFDELRKHIDFGGNNSKDLSYQDVKIINRSQFLVKTTRDLNSFFYYKVPMLPKPFQISMHDGFAVLDTRFYFTVSNSDVAASAEVYNTVNYNGVYFALEHDSLVFKQWEKQVKPAWFGKKNLRNNFQRAELSVSKSQSYSYLISYPSLVNLNQGIKFEVPVEALKKMKQSEGNDFLKGNEPGFISTCVYQVDLVHVALFFVGKRTLNLYAAIFDHQGNFKNIELLREHVDFDGIFHSFDDQLYRFWLRKNQVSGQKELWVYTYELQIEN